MTTDYRQTVFLPRSTFSMRGKPDEQAYVGEIVRGGSNRNGSDFVLHDGPPYANGNLHLGHALNKVLKDIVCRSQEAMGKSVGFRPGWDCHGLPIEWAVEKELLEQKIKKGDITPLEFRERCRTFAAKWVETQREEFEQLGVLADWSSPYLTMSAEMEAMIFATFSDIAKQGYLYRGKKPVMWSPVEQTALAEAEVESADVPTPTIYVGFPVVKGPDDLIGTHVLIWTTTPWSLPGNRAIAFNREFSYGLYTDRNFVGQRVIMADNDWSRQPRFKKLRDVDPSELVCAHPLRGSGYDFDVPLFDAQYVKNEVGTGFVHLAPGHGGDDYKVCQANGLAELPDTINDRGIYHDHVPLFAGLAVTKGKSFGPANDAVIEKIAQAQCLHDRVDQPWPFNHSWRSGAIVIERATDQWFIRVADAKDQAGSLLKNAEFYPDAGRTRLGSMMATRPDWLISRQRVWGTPMGLFVHKETGEPCLHEKVLENTRLAFQALGGDAWWSQPDSVFFGGSGLNASDYEKVMDVLDVWFDSACTHRLLPRPSDLVLEGSDQHRGWFQTSLIVSSLLDQRAPSTGYLTHGFLLDGNGVKMAKSKGNVIPPKQVIDQFGVDVLRLWIAACDYTQDVRASMAIFKSIDETYKKVRNTFRYLLGALDGYTADEAPEFVELQPLERYVLGRLNSLNMTVTQSYAEYNFSAVVRQVVDFITTDLSAFYFDIRKDCLYCDRPDAMRRRGYRFVLNEVLRHLATWMTPIIPFTMHEVEEHLGRSLDPHLLTDPKAWGDHPEEVVRWAVIKDALTIAQAALEDERDEIKSNLDASVVVHADPAVVALFSGVEVADVFRVSHAMVTDNPIPPTAYVGHLGNGSRVGVTVTRAQGKKCARSWKVLEEVGSDDEYPDLSLRDADAVRNWKIRNGN